MQQINNSYIIPLIKSKLGILVNNVIYYFVNNKRKIIYKKRKKLFPKGFCNAPFSNLFFSADGNIGVCCFNRDFSIGKYPEIQLKNIWTSRKLNEFRKSFKELKPHPGCLNCWELIKSGNFNNSPAADFELYNFNKKYPEKIELEISFDCNISCLMCSFENLVGKPPIKNKISIYNKKFIEEIKPFIKNAKQVKFLGGEPFFIEEYYILWDYLIKENKKCIIFVQTNGTILNNKILEMLKVGNFHFCISLDSLNPENLEKIRKGINFSTLQRNIDFFIEYCKKNKRYVGIAVTPIIYNIYDIPDLVRFCNQKNIYITFNNIVKPTHLTINTLSITKLNEILDFYSSIDFSLKTKIQKKNYHAFTTLINQIEKIIKEKSLKAKLLSCKSIDEINTVLQEMFDINENIKLIIEILKEKDDSVKIIHQLFNNEMINIIKYITTVPSDILREKIEQLFEQKK